MRDIFVSFLGTGVVQLANLCSGILLARLLGPDGRGELAVVMLWPALLAGLGALAINDGVVYFGATKRSTPGTLLASSFAVGFALSTVIVLLALIVIPFVYADYRPAVREAAYLYLAFVPLTYLAHYSSSIFQGYLHLGAWNVLRVIPAITYVLFILLAALLGWATIAGFAVASLLSTAAGLGAALVLLAHRGWLTWKLDPSTMRSLLSYGLPIHLGAILLVANVRLDQVLISQWLTPADLGVFVVAFSLVGALAMISMTLSSVAFPKIGAQQAMDGKALVLGRYLRLTLALIGGAVPLFILFGPWLILFLFGASFLDAASILQILALGALGQGCSSMLKQGLKAIGATRVVAKGELFSLIINAAALLTLLSLYGIQGAAWAFVAVQSATALVFLFAFRQETGVEVRRLLSPSAEDWLLVKRHFGALWSSEK